MNVTVLSIEFPISKCLPFFFLTDADKKIQMSSEIQLLAGTKVYYYFNLKGDNFNVNQL